MRVGTSRKGINLGEKNHNWKGNNVTYHTLHNWIRRRLVKPELCPKCQRKVKLQLSCKDHKYIKDLTLWSYLCQSCHRKADGANNIKKFYCKLCNKRISRTSGKYGKGRCNKCARKEDQRSKK